MNTKYLMIEPKEKNARNTIFTSRKLCILRTVRINQKLAVDLRSNMRDCLLDTVFGAAQSQLVVPRIIFFFLHLWCKRPLHTAIYPERILLRPLPAIKININGKSLVQNVFGMLLWFSREIERSSRAIETHHFHYPPSFFGRLHYIYFYWNL